MIDNRLLERGKLICTCSSCSCTRTNTTKHYFWSWNVFCGMNSLDYFAGFFWGGGDFALIYFGNKSVNTLKRTPYNGQKLVNLRNEFFLQRLFDVSNLLHSGFMHDLHSTYKHVCKSSKFDKSCRPSRQNITLTFTGFTVWADYMRKIGKLRGDFSNVGHYDNFIAFTKQTMLTLAW